MPGITRIKIVGNHNGRGSWRFGKGEPHWSEINGIYRRSFDLAPGEEIVKCTKNELLARYDIEFGVDVLLTFNNGMTSTTQEKVLGYTGKTTVTVEYKQNPDTDENGDWFKLKVDYYFVGYCRDDKNTPPLDEWILLDWNEVKRSNSIMWFDNRNKADGARASFKYAYFARIPEECILAGWFKPTGSRSKTYVGKLSRGNNEQLALF